MISINEALQVIKNNIPSPVARNYFVEEVAGKILAEDIHAPEPSPRYSNSAMDGYAVRWEDVCGAEQKSPVSLKIVGESKAGAPFQEITRQGEAIRISTGAMITEGCDTVVRIEDTEENNGVVHIRAVRRQGQDIRYRGEEFQEGELLLTKRSKLSAPEVALLAAVGINMVKAYKPCEVAILVTGSELVGKGEKIAEYQIRDSNMIMLKTAIEESGGKVVYCGYVLDEKKLQLMPSARCRQISSSLQAVFQLADMTM